MTATEAVSAHLNAKLKASSSLVTIVGTSICKGRLEEGMTLPGVVHSIISGDPSIYVASNAGTDPHMANEWVNFQLEAQDSGDSYARCYQIIALAQAAIMSASTQGDKTVYPPVPTQTRESEQATLGERYPRVIFEYTVLVSQAVGVGS